MKRTALFFRQNLEVVDDLAHCRPVFLGHGAQALHQVRDGAFLAQEFLPEGAQVLLGIDLADLPLHLFPKRFDPLLHDRSLLPENIKFDYITRVP